MALDGPQTKRFCDLVTPLFNPATLDQALFFRFGQSLHSVARAGETFNIQVFDVVRYYDHRGHLGNLVGALMQQNPDPGLHDGLAEFLVVAPQPTRVPQVVRSLTLGPAPSLPFVNRKELRDHLDAVTAPAFNWRALSLNGVEASGKSWSWHLIREVATIAGRVPVLVDVSEESPTLREVCEAIVLRLGLDWEEVGKVFVDAPKPERIAMRFWIALRPHCETLLRPFWLVLDGLSARTVDAEVKEKLIPHLLREVARDPLPNLFPILLGDHAGREPKLRNLFLHENVPTLSDTDLRTFLDDWSRARAFEMDVADRDHSVARILGDAKPPFDHPAMEQITDALIAVLKKLEEEMAHAG